MVDSLQFPLLMDKFLELTEAQLDGLRDEFDKGDGLSVEEFVSVMLKLLPQQDGQQRLELVHELSDLFAQVDINGDGSMEFEEFTHFFISSGAPPGQCTRFLPSPPPCCYPVLPRHDTE